MVSPGLITTTAPFSVVLPAANVYNADSLECICIILHSICRLFSGLLLITIVLVVAFTQALPGQQTPENVPSFKLVLVGDGGTGIFCPNVTVLWLPVYLTPPSLPLL